MVREGLVVLQRESPGEAVLVIRVPDWPAGYTAVLYPDDGEWACDCGGADPCAHVVAAALALASDEARPPAAVTVAGRLRYEILPSLTGVVIGRQIVRTDGSSTALDGPLSSVDVLLTPGEGDLAIDRLLGDRPTRTRGDSRRCP